MYSKKKKSLRAQLNGYLYQAERVTINQIISELPEKEDQDAVRLSLLSYAKLCGGLPFLPLNKTLRYTVMLCIPVLAISLLKADDYNYNAACPYDIPNEIDED